MDVTLDVLPGENEIVTETFRRERRTCDECGESAHYKCTYLLDGARSNPRSAAYGCDDCTYCEDDCRFACKEHREKVWNSPPEGMGRCSAFPATARLAHLFLRKVKTKCPPPKP